MAPELYHKEFAVAGQKPGLQVWRVEQLDLVPVPVQQHGSFFVGDAYLVLYTAAGPRQGFFYRLHFWLGIRSYCVGTPWCTPKHFRVPKSQDIEL
uniref:Uncharacterized protein n=1 Tax=Monodelphis domestica TaxID=13616 RepID=A0A5F8H3V4_MONDO